MTTPDQPGQGPRPPGAGPGNLPGDEGQPGDGGQPDGSAESWDWSMDPPPPAGPSQEPAPDPNAGRTVDETPRPMPEAARVPPPVPPATPIAGTTSGPADDPAEGPTAGPTNGPANGSATGPPEGSATGPAEGSATGISLPGETPGTPQPPVQTPTAPDWSTPDTPASTPPLGGYGNPPARPAEPADRESTPGPGQPGPGQPGPGQPGPGQPGPTGAPRGFAPPGDRRWWFVLGIVAALLSCCCVAAAVIALAWGPDLYAGLRDESPRVVGLNQPARDGDLEFRVHGVRCGVGRVGDPLISQLAVGQFCVVQLRVRNVGAQPVIFHDSLQTAYGPAGERFGADSTAGLLANADQQAFLSEINPGNRVTGALVYDIPPDSRIVRLRLHQSAHSTGVLVQTG